MNTITAEKNKQPSKDLYNHEDSDNACFLCGNPRYTLKYNVEHFGFPFQFKQCACGVIKQTPLPNERFFDWFFNSDIFFRSKTLPGLKIWGYYDYFKGEPGRLATSKWRYKKLARFLEDKKPKEILKIGPSTGTFLWVANQAGHHAIGCDISSEFIEYARKNYNVHIDQGRFEHRGYSDNQFDVILLMNVIENVPNMEEFLHAVHRGLKPGGTFILNFVDMGNNWIEKIQKDRYFMYRPPICYGFSSKVMEQILHKMNFSVAAKFRDIRYFNLEKTFSLLGFKTLLKLAQFLRIDQIHFPIYAYPSRIIVAQKNATISA